ncbi:MAG: hypothetical protein WDA08_02590 [Weeksellaceae bacterium]
MTSFLITTKEELTDMTLLSQTWDNSNIKLIETGETLCYLQWDETLKDEAYYFEENSSWIYAVGTFFYKDFSFSDSLKFVLSDFAQDKLSNEEMYGHYVLLIYHDQKFHLLNDALGAIRLFSNAEKTRFSTSFLGLWFSQPQTLQLNQWAVYEKIAKGYICAPDTLVETIKDSTYEAFQLPFLIKHPNPETVYQKGTQSADYQISEIKKYYNRVFNLAEGKSISLGISGGFDSRMLMGLLQNYPNPYLFTHHTKGIHSNEKVIAQKLTESIGQKLHIKETPKADTLNPKEAEKLFKDLIYYYDGRTANNSGAFSITGTKEYNLFHLKEQVIGLNGKGGEVYRNYYNIANRSYSFQDWFTALELYSSADFVFNTEQKKQLLGKIHDKIRNRLSVEKNWSRWHIQRYYSEIRQADCEASILSAHNKITRYIAPFLDAKLLKIAYQSYSIAGGDSSFQMKMIQKLNPKLAAINSNYGHNFMKIPLKLKIKESLVKSMPLKFRTERLKKVIKKADDLPLSETEKQALSFLKAHFPDINVDYCFSHYAQKNVVTNLAYLLMEAQRLNKIMLQ